MTTTTVPGDLRARRAPAQIAHYRVFELIGTGGMGHVYRAEDTALNREVALKVLAARPDDPLAVRRFLREARALAAVRHPNLVTVYAAGEDGGTVYLAMELLKGETLDTRARRGPLPAREVARIGAQIAAGLGAIHARGLIHRDIKPANVWLVEPGPGEERPECDVKILDFGLARAADSTSHLTEVGAVVGTPAYMSPEQARGAELDARTDLFSLGCVLYALATGCAPFQASDPVTQAVLMATEAHLPARACNPAVPAALSALIDDLLAKNPNDRPATADEVRERLRGAGRPRAAHRAGLVALVSGVWVVVLALLAAALWPSAPHPTFEYGYTIRPEVAFLSDLPVLSERRFPPPHHPQPPGATGTVRVRGTTHDKGLFMHGAPAFDVPAYRSYAVPEGRARFVTEVALCESARGYSGLVFVARADDRELWHSPPVYADSPKAKCDVDVSGAKVLTLEVRTIGPHHGAHGAWIDPRFTNWRPTPVPQLERAASGR